MRIEHIAMYVNDLERAKGFFRRYFGAVPGDDYHNKKQISAPVFFHSVTAPGWKL